MSFRPDTIERKLARLEKKLRESRDEFFARTRGQNSRLTGGIGVGAGARGGTGSFQGMRSFIPQDITIDDLDENRVSTGNFEHITLGGGAFLRVKPNTGIAGEIKFIHGSLQDGQFLIFTPDATQPLTTLTLKTGGNIAIGTDLLLRLDEIAIGIFDETLTSPDPNGNYMIQGVGGVACPVICPENDLGDVSGVTQIDWSLSPFHRMRMVGETNIIMTGLPTKPGWHEITVQFLEDPTGGHPVFFFDIFRNSPVPVIRKGANRYTIVKFYSYVDDQGTPPDFDNIFVWQPPYLTLTEEAQPSINQGMIHAILNTDQTSDLAVNDHIEFRTILFTNNLALSSAAGQLAGIFTGFKTARTYELTGVLGGDRGAPFGGSISYQWFNSAQGLIGSQGTLQDPGQDNPYQQVAKAFFQPSDISDTVELRIISQSPNPIDVIYSGFPSGLTSDQTPQSFAEIKDCGQTQEQFEASLQELLDEDTIIQPRNPPIGFNVNSVLYQGFNARNLWSNVVGTGLPLNLPIIDGAILVPFVREGVGEFTYLTEGYPPVTGSPTSLDKNGLFVAGTFGFIRRVRVKVSRNSMNKAFTVSIMRDDGVKTTLFTIGAGINTSVLNSGNTPIDVGRGYAYHFQTTDGLIPSGSLDISFSIEIEWGFV